MGNPQILQLVSGGWVVLELLPNSAGASATVSWAFSSNVHLISWVLSNPQVSRGGN